MIFFVLKPGTSDIKFCLNAPLFYLLHIIYIHIPVYSCVTVFPLMTQAAERFCLEHGLDEAMQTVLMPQLIQVRAMYISGTRVRSNTLSWLIAESRVEPPVTHHRVEQHHSIILLFYFVCFHHLYVPPQFVGGYALIDLLDKSRSQVPSLLPPDTCCTTYLSRSQHKDLRSARGASRWYISLDSPKLR